MIKCYVENLFIHQWVVNRYPVNYCLPNFKKAYLLRIKLYRMFAIIFEEIVSTPHSVYAESVLLWFSFCFTLFHLCSKNMIFQLALSRPKLNCFFHGVLFNFRLNVFVFFFCHQRMISFTIWHGIIWKLMN